MCQPRGFLYYSDVVASVIFSNLSLTQHLLDEKVSGNMFSSSSANWVIESLRGLLFQTPSERGCKRAGRGEELYG